jgi:hypothetical protein
MYRALLCGLGVGWAATVGAQTPVSVHPQTLPGSVVPAPNSATRTMPVSNVNRPVSDATPAAVPATPALAPTHPAVNPSWTSCGPATGGEPLCGTRTLVSRLSDWLCYKPAPRVLPVFAPTPYVGNYLHAFPCKPQANGCSPATAAKGHAAPACRDGKCGTPLIQGRLFGGCDPCRDTLFDRLLSHLTPLQFGHCSACGAGCPTGTPAITTAASGPLNCTHGCGPATPGLCGQKPYTFRFANPLCPPTAVGYGQPATPTPGTVPAAMPTMPAGTPVAPAAPPVPSANKPFTNP